MRILLVLLAALLVGAAPATPARDWTAAVTRAPSGVFVIGNPQARVRIVEYGSYTCPHCAAFAHESQGVLHDRLIRSGSTSLEYHHLVRDPLDLAAVMLARCAGAERFAALHQAIFAAQDDWLPRGFAFQQTNAQRIGMYPRLAQLRAYADGAGLTALAQARGVPAAAIDACFADSAGLDRLLQLTAQIPAGVDSTPTFFVNGKLVAHVGWAGLEPALRAAGAR